MNGQPFRKLREERIDQLLRDLAQPELKPPLPGVPSANAGPADEARADQTAPDAAESSLNVDNSLAARLRRYASATRRAPSRDEVGWFLANWTDGPVLLLLDENYQRVRAAATPLFTILDRDEDGLLSAPEIASAEKSLRSYDTTQDEVLSSSELNKGAERTPQAKQPAFHP